MRLIYEEVTDGAERIIRYEYIGDEAPNAHQIGVLATALERTTPTNRDVPLTENLYLSLATLALQLAALLKASPQPYSEAAIEALSNVNAYLLSRNIDPNWNVDYMGYEWATLLGQ